MPKDLTLTRGVRENNDLFRNIDNAVFTASKWVGPRKAECVGHAMLTMMTPGEIWPTHEGGTTVPVELTSVFVHPDFRRMGLGHAMVSRCIEYCNRRNLECILRVTPYGRVHLEAEQLVRWYKRLGFVVYSRDEQTSYMFKAPTTHKAKA